MIEKSRVVMNKSDTWSEQVSYYRFFSNDRVKETHLISSMENHCKLSSAGKGHLLLIEDTTELNMEKHRNRIGSKDKLGLTGNNIDLGFFCHPTIVVDPADASLAGIIDLHLWHREENKQEKTERRYRRLPFEEKESWRWDKQAVDSRKRLEDVETITVIQDREGDIYESFCTLRQSGVNWVIRSAQNRLTKGGKLHEQLNDFPVAGAYEMVISADNKKRIHRKAILEVRYATVDLCRPAVIKGKNKYQETLPVQVVHVKEKADSVPQGETAVEWILYTSHTVNSLADAREIVYYYTLRWLIEDLFRTLKREGLNYESSELESGKALRKLLVLSLMAAVQILQLRQARDGTTLQVPSLVFSDDQLACLEDILPRFEGKTEKQKNPYSKNNLAWAAWIIARLGGWKGYSSQRPPGVITFHDGWTRFHHVFEGWVIAKDVYKR
jgi:hypothetical protein